MIRSSEFNCMDFGRYIDWLRLAAQSLFKISGHPEVFTAIIILIIIIINTLFISRKTNNKYRKVIKNIGIGKKEKRFIILQFMLRISIQKLFQRR